MVIKKKKEDLPTVQIELNYLEAGMLHGLLLREGLISELPPQFRLKLNMLFTSAYMNHDTLGTQARKDMKKYQKDLDSHL